MKQIKKDTYELSTGKTFYANCGIIGLAPGKDAISEGYDGTVYYPHERENPSEWPGALTDAERLEIAQFMIKLWEEYMVRVLLKGT